MASACLKAVYGISRFRGDCSMILLINVILDAGCKELCMWGGGLKGKGFGKNDGGWWSRIIWLVLMLAFCAVPSMKSQDVTRCKSPAR